MTWFSICGPSSKLTEQTASRIVPLGEGQFLALTREFRKRLDELRSYGENYGNGVRFHPLAAPALEDFAAEVGDFSADEHWQAYIKRLAAAQNLETPLPSTLQAELRDYQEEGFQWLARLAQTGMGACLADDMGLGKNPPGPGRHSPPGLPKDRPWWWPRPRSA